MRIAIALAMLAFTAHAEESLELTLVSATASGPQWEATHGCYEYGIVVRVLTRETNLGRSLASHLNGMTDLEVSRETAGQPSVPGLMTFWRQEIRRIHAAPRTDPLDAETLARAMCRAKDGRTWEM